MREGLVGGEAECVLGGLDAGVVGLGKVCVVIGFVVTGLVLSTWALFLAGVLVQFVAGMVKALRSVVAPSVCSCVRWILAAFLVAFLLLGAFLHGVGFMEVVGVVGKLAGLVWALFLVWLVRLPEGFPAQTMP